MKNTIQILILASALVVALSLAGCGGGGGGSSSGPTSYPPQYTHDQWAQLFVNGMDDATLMKADTQQAGYIVVLNHESGNYEAYDLSAISTYKSTIAQYIVNYPPIVLQPMGNNNYVDPMTGTQFQKMQFSAQKNLAKIAAIKEDLVVQNNAQTLRLKYGLSVDSAVDVARFAYKIKNSAQGTYNKGDYDAFMKDMTGSTITDFETDAKNGDDNSLDARIQKAEQMTGMGPEGVNKLITEMFGQ